MAARAVTVWAGVGAERGRWAGPLADTAPVGIEIAESPNVSLQQIFIW